MYSAFPHLLYAIFPQSAPDISTCLSLAPSLASLQLLSLLSLTKVTYVKLQARRPRASVAVVGSDTVVPRHLLNFIVLEDILGESAAACARPAPLVTVSAGKNDLDRVL